MNNICITTKALPKVVHNLQKITADMQELNARYATAIYDENAISIAKKERAMLNNIVKDLDDKRKTVKNAYLEPYNLFDKEIKALEGIIQPAIDNIDKQIKTFEESERTAKRAEITGCFETKIASLKDFVTLDKIWDNRWLNKGSDMESITAEIEMSIEKINNDLMSIEDLGSENESQLKAIYFRNLDLSSAISENARLKRETAKVEQSGVSCAAKITDYVKKVEITKDKQIEQAQSYSISFKATKKQFSEIHSLLFSMKIEWKDNNDLNF